MKRILFILCCTLLIGLTTAACGEVVEEGTTDAVQDDSAAEVEADQFGGVFFGDAFDFGYEDSGVVRDSQIEAIDAPRGRGPVRHRR